MLRSLGGRCRRGGRLGHRGRGGRGRRDVGRGRLLVQGDAGAAGHTGRAQAHGVRLARRARRRRSGAQSAPGGRSRGVAAVGLSGGVGARGVVLVHGHPGTAGHAGDGLVGLAVRRGGVERSQTPGGLHGRRRARVLLGRHLVQAGEAGRGRGGGRLLTRGVRGDTPTLEPGLGGLGFGLTTTAGGDHREDDQDQQHDDDRRDDPVEGGLWHGGAPRSSGATGRAGRRVVLPAPPRGGEPGLEDDTGPGPPTRDQPRHPAVPRGRHRLPSTPWTRQPSHPAPPPPPARSTPTCSRWPARTARASCTP